MNSLADNVRPGLVKSMLMLVSLPSTTSLFFFIAIFVFSLSLFGSISSEKKEKDGIIADTKILYEKYILFL
jgi:hypothetical protein